MLRLLSLLQTHRYWTGRDLAERLGVSERTLRRDVDRLRELGYPVEAARGVSGGYQLQAGAALPPLLLDDDEAVAIAVSLRTAAGGVVAGIEESSVRALSKIVQVMPAHLRRRVAALQDYTVPVMSGATIDGETLTTLAQACRDDERVELDYTKPGADAVAERRTVEPHRLVSLERRWYLVAWDLARADWRSFRVDRISAPRLTGARFRQRELPAADAAEFVMRGFPRPDLFGVEVLVHEDAATVRRKSAPWAEVEEIDASTCRLRMRVDQLAWPAMMLGAIGADFEVVSPPELVDHLAEIGARFTRCSG